MRKEKKWNRCDKCGKFINYASFENGSALRRLITPDSHFTAEEYETLCPTHNQKEEIHAKG